VGDFTDLERVRVRQAPLLLKGIDFLNQHFGVDHHAVADHAHLAVVQYARRDEPDDGFLPPNNQGVTRVVPTLKTDNDVRLAGEQVHHLAFAFIAPLDADNNECAHWLLAPSFRLNTHKRIS